MCRDGRGATLIEILVALSLVAMAFGAIFAIYVQSGRTDARQDREQEYQSLLARLEERARRDIRSSLAIQTAGDGSTELRMLAESGEAEPVEVTVTYRQPGAGPLVERVQGEAVETFDFGWVLEGKPLVFQIK